MAKSKKKKPITKDDPIRTYVTFILDRSGSMQSCVQETINGYNENVQVIHRTADEQDMVDRTFVTLVQFNDRIKFTQLAAPLTNLKEIDDQIYRPNGCTAMLDAIGETLARMDREIEDRDNHRYLVTVFSDGEENSSKEYTYDTIAKMIQSRQNNNRWTFSYIGANQDLARVAERTAIPRANMLAYEANPSGSMISWRSLSESVQSFMCHANDGGGTLLQIDDFDEPNDNDEIH